MGNRPPISPYKTIYICDSFGLGGNREQDAEALRRCYAQLAPGGTLVVSYELPNNAAERWSYWLPEERKRLPEPWPDAGTRRQAANGEEIERRATRGAGGTASSGKPVLSHEFLLLLANAGFANVSVRNRYSAKEATADGTMLVFIAKK